MSRFLPFLLALVVASVPTTAAAERVVVLAEFSFRPVRDLIDFLGKEGHVVLDESRLLTFTGPIGAITLGAVDVPPPSWWPTALDADWKQMADACMEAGGSPPYNLRNRGSFLCGRGAAPALQQRYLEHRAPAFVIEVEGRPAGNQIALRVSLYAPDESRALVQTSEPLDEPRLGVTLVRLTRLLLEGEGSREPRSVERELPRGNPLFQRVAPSLEGKTIGAAHWSRRCAAPLPAELRVSPPEALSSQALVATWQKTLGEIEFLPGGAPEETCTLETSSQSVSFSGQTSLLRALRGTLDCGGRSISAVTQAVQPDSASAALSLARRLTLAALTRWCPEDEVASKEHWIQVEGSAKIVRGKVGAAKRRAKILALEAAVKKSGLPSGEVKAYRVLGSKCTRKRCSITVRADIARASEATTQPAARSAPPAPPEVSTKGPAVRLHVSGIVGPTHLDAFRRRLRSKILGIYSLEAGPLEDDRVVLEIRGSLEVTELRAALQGQAQGIFEGEVKVRPDGDLSLSIQH